MASTPALSPRRGEMITMWVLLGASFAATFAPAGIEGLLALVLGWLPVVFVFWHFIRWAGAFTALWSFVVIVVVSFITEALGVATGLVFGNYYYPDGPLGPLVLGVPPLVMLQYFAMSYSALMIARAVSGSLTRAVTGWGLVAVTAMAAFAQTLLDVVADPWHATVLQQWIWRDGGPYFGVPFQNFVGWWVETFIFLIVVQWLLSRSRAVAHITAEKPRGFYAQAVLLYGTFIVAAIAIPFVQPVTGDAKTIADAMVIIAMFAVAPLWVAGLFGLRHSQH